MKLKTYAVVLDGSQQRVTLAGNNFLADKKILFFFRNSSGASQFGYVNVSDIEVTIYSKNGEIIREAINPANFNTSSVDVEVLKNVTSFENIDLERSFVWNSNPAINTIVLLHFVVIEE
jgi:hypothetical protein